MAKAAGMFVYIGTYPSEAAAKADYDIVKELHADGAVGTYDAGLVTKDESGKVHVNKDEMATRHGGWGGAAAGAVVGILFPPSIIATALVGGAIGGISGHLWRGISRAEVKELGRHHRRGTGRPGGRRRQHDLRLDQQGRPDARQACQQGFGYHHDRPRRGLAPGRHRSQLS